MKIYIILGSTRQNRKSEKVAQWVMDHAIATPKSEFELVDLRDWTLPFYDEVAGPADLKENYSHPEGKKWAKKISEADAYIIVAPEYNHSYPAVLKNALDHAYNEWVRKPIAFVSYGGASGGSRSVEHLRTVAVELQMVPIRPGVHITNIWNAFDETGHLKDQEKYGKNLQLLFDDLIWWTKLLKTAREETK